MAVVQIINVLTTIGLLPRVMATVVSTDHYTTHGCLCADSWSYKGSVVSGCSGSGLEHGGRMWCRISPGCKSSAGADADGPWDFCFQGKDPRLHHVLVVDSCLSTVMPKNGPNKNLDHWPEVLRPDEHRAAIRCCSQDGMACGNRSWWKDHTSGAREICWQDALHSRAVEICKENGLRLCSPDELTKGVCCSKQWTPCNNLLTWTTAGVRFPNAFGMQPDSTYKGGPVPVADVWQ